MDPKHGVDYFAFEDLPHLAGPLIVDPMEASSRLDQLVFEMDSRYARFRRDLQISLNTTREPQKPIGCPSFGSSTMNSRNG